MSSTSTNRESRIIYQFPPDSERNLFIIAEISSEVRNPVVLNAITEVDRDHFIPDIHKELTWSEVVIPTDGTSLTQLSLVAKMLDFAGLTGKGKSLEIGGGTGYVTALLAAASESAYSVEVVESLTEKANQRLKELGIENAHVFTGDGTLGLPEFAPFNSIIVSAAMTTIPQVLIDQMADEASMVIPVAQEHPLFGKDNESCLLMLCIKKGDNVIVRPIGHVYFMPAISENEGGWTEDEYEELVHRKDVHASFVVAEVSRKKFGQTIEEFHTSARAQLAAAGERELTDVELNRYLLRLFKIRGILDELYPVGS